MSKKYTPGPWEAGGHDNSEQIKIWGRRTLVATVSDSSMSRARKAGEQEGNVMLIVAAPQMLDALKAVLSSVMAEDCREDAVLCVVRSAIAKAEGGFV